IIPRVRIGPDGGRVWAAEGTNARGTSRRELESPWPPAHEPAAGDRSFLWQRAKRRDRKATSRSITCGLPVLSSFGSSPHREFRCFIHSAYSLIKLRSPDAVVR